MSQGSSDGSCAACGCRGTSERTCASGSPSARNDAGGAIPAAGERDVRPCGGSGSDIRRELFNLVRRFRHDRYDMRSLLADDLGMTSAEAHVLAYLLRCEREERKARPSDVAHRGRISPSAISQTLKTLEEKGAIVRGRSSSDSRSVTLTLTEEGRALACELHRRRADFVDALIEHVGEDEMGSFVSTLARIMEFCDTRLWHADGEGRSFSSPGCPDGTPKADVRPGSEAGSGSCA